MKKPIDFAKLVKAFRKEKGLTQKQLGDLAGITLNTVGAIEEGRAEPKMSYIISWCIAYNTTIDDFISMKKVKYNSTPATKVLDAYQRLTKDRRDIVDFILGTSTSQ